MANMIKKQEYGVRKTILVAPELAFTLPCVVKTDGVVANEQGKKIVKAGTPVVAEGGIAGGILLNRNTPVTETADIDQLQGMLLHDVDVDADNNGTVLISGYVDINKLDADIAEKYENYSNNSKITLIKGV